jgi:hypothetical protein
LMSIWKTEITVWALVVEVDIESGRKWWCYLNTLTVSVYNFNDRKGQENQEFWVLCLKLRCSRTFPCVVSVILIMPLNSFRFCK